MKKIVLILIYFSFSSKSFSQIEKVDLFNKFDSCLHSFLLQFNQDKKDSLFIFYPPQSVILSKNFNHDGINYSVVKKLDDTLQRGPINKGSTVIIHYYSFDAFMNFILTKHSLDSASLSKFNGAMAYVSVPSNAWDQFYFDFILGYDSLFITPSVEYIEYKKTFAVHSRYLLQCCYTKKAGFFITKVDKIRNRQVAY